MDSFGGKSVLSALYLMGLMYQFNKNCMDAKTKKEKKNKWADNISGKFSKTAC